MAAVFQITSILLICFLSEVNYSSAFPRARSSMYPEAWQVVKETLQEGHGYGIRRPLQYIQALRQPHRKLQPNAYGQVQVITWQKPQGSSLSAYSHAQIQNQPGLYHQTRSPYLTRPDVATEWTQEMSPSQPPPQRNYLQFKPRSFEFSLKVPFVNFPHQNKDTSSITKGSALNSSGSDGAGYSQLYRPSSVQIQSSFNSPSGSDGFSDKGSTDNPNGGKNANDVSKPSFQLSFSVPIPSPTPSTKPISSNVGYFENLQRPGSVSFVQTSNMEPATLQSSSTQNGFFLNSAGTVQQQREDQLVTFSTAHVSQHATATEQTSQDKIPTEQSQVFPKPGLTNNPASSQPTPNYPLQSENVHSGYYNGQVNPSLSPSKYERAPSGHYNSGQLKPNGNKYGQGQTGQPIGSQFTSASEQYNYGQFKPSFSYGQNEETLSHPASPIIPSSQYERPLFGYHNREVATTANYDRKGNVVLIGQMDFSSSSPYQYNKVQSGQALPDHLTAFNHLPNSQDLSTDYQTQVRLPGQSTDRWQHDGKPNYTKLLIDMEDKTDGADGQNNYFAAATTHYDPYFGKWTGQNKVAPPVRNPSPLSMEPQSLISMSQHQITGFEYEQKGTERPDTTFETPSMDCVGEQHASNPQKQNAVFVPTNFDQQQMSESTSQSVPHTFGLSYGQYPIGQMQPTSDQSVVANYPSSVNRINYFNIYGLNH